MQQLKFTKHFGPGLLESVYEEGLCYELSKARISFRGQVDLPVIYKGVQLDCGYRIDLLVEEGAILELKSVEKLLPIHGAQLLTYLKMMDKRLGLLINFNVPVLRDGIKRIANRL